MSTATATPRIPAPHVCSPDEYRVRWIDPTWAEVSKRNGRAKYEQHCSHITGDWSCNCPDFNSRKRACKHIIFALTEMPAVCLCGTWFVSTFNQLGLCSVCAKATAAPVLCLCRKCRAQVPLADFVSALDCCKACVDGAFPKIPFSQAAPAMCSLCGRVQVYNGFTFCQTCAAAELASALKSAPRLCDWCHQDIARQAGLYCSDKCHQAACADGVLDMVPSAAMTEPEQPAYEWHQSYQAMAHCAATNCGAVFPYTDEGDWSAGVLCPAHRAIAVVAA